jgi:hypothetical protein
LVSTLYYSGEFETARQYAMRGVQIWPSGAYSITQKISTLPLSFVLCYEALCQWHVGEIASCHPTMEDAISLAKELNETNSLAVALHLLRF